MMICTDGMSLVLGIGWSRMQIERMIFSTAFKGLSILHLRAQEGSQMIILHLATSSPERTPMTFPSSIRISSMSLFRMKVPPLTAHILENPSAIPPSPYTGYTKGESPYLPIESMYSLIFSIISKAGRFMNSSLVYRATAWPRKSIVFYSSPNFLNSSSEVFFSTLNSFQDFLSLQSKVWIQSQNFLQRFFSSIPMRSELKAQESFPGTLLILGPPFEKKPASLFWRTQVPSMHFHSKYFVTPVFSRVRTKLPAQMMYLGMRSMFQSRFMPSSEGGFQSPRYIFQRLVRLIEAPSPPQKGLRSI